MPPTLRPQAAVTCGTRSIWKVRSPGFGPSTSPSRRRDCHSAAPPSTFSRCLNRDGERERQQNDSLANGYHRHSRSSACSGQHRGSPRRRRPPAWSLRSSVAAAAAAAAVIISTAFRRRCRKPTARHSAGPKTLPPAEIAERVFPDGWLFGKREVYLVHAVGWRRVLGRDCRVDPLHCVPDAVEDQWP